MKLFVVTFAVLLAVLPSHCDEDNGSERQQTTLNVGTLGGLGPGLFLSSGPQPGESELIITNPLTNVVLETNQPHPHPHHPHLQPHHPHPQPHHPKPQQYNTPMPIAPPHHKNPYTTPYTTPYPTMAPNKHHPVKHHPEKHHPEKHHPDKHHPDKHHTTTPPPNQHECTFANAKGVCTSIPSFLGCIRGGGVLAPPFGGCSFIQGCCIKVRNLFS